MKIFILATLLFASTAFADVHLEIAEVKGEVKAADIKVEEGVEGDLLAAPVIDNEEQSAENVRTVTITNTGDEAADEINGQLEMLSPNLEETEDGFGNDLDNGSTKAQDYNSSRCNRRGARAANHNSTRSNRGRRLDTDDDDDSVKTKANAVDNDCDDDVPDSRKQKR